MNLPIIYAVNIHSSHYIITLVERNTLDFFLFKPNPFIQFSSDTNEMEKKKLTLFLSTSQLRSSPSKLLQTKEHKWRSSNDGSNKSSLNVHTIIFDRQHLFRINNIFYDIHQNKIYDKKKLIVNISELTTTLHRLIMFDVFFSKF